MISERLLCDSPVQGHPNEISVEEYNDLVEQHIMFKDMSADEYLLSAGIASHWPEGRGCYIAADEQVKRARLSDA